MTTQQDTTTVLDLARRACAARGLDPSRLRLIRHYSNAVIEIPSARAVARVATGPHDHGQVRRSVGATRWLHEQGFPTVVPLAGVDPVELAPDASVSFWEYLPQPEPPAIFDSVDLASLLAQLHALPAPPEDLAPCQPLTSLEETLRGDAAARVLSTSEHRWLVQRVAEVREDLAGREWPLGEGLVHGDAWLGNLMTSPDGLVLADWDRVAWGPRELDLVPTWHATRRYGRDRSWTDRFVAIYGYDLRASPLYEDLMTMRDLAQLPGPMRRAPHSGPHSRALRQRLGDLMSADRHSTWVAL